MRLNKILSLTLASTVMVLGALPAEAQGKKIASKNVSSIGSLSSKKVVASSISIKPGKQIASPLTILPPQGGLKPGKTLTPKFPFPRFPRGHFETQCCQVWIRGCGEVIVYVPPVYETFCDPCGNISRVLVREGYSKVVIDYGHFETRCHQVWVNGGFLY